jgi:hypothetical protein
MAWFDALPHCQIRHDFASLVTHFSILHRQFCKEKNTGSFVAIADMANTIVRDLIETNQPPAPEAVASFITVLRAQHEIIIHTKQGLEDKVAFDQINAQIIQGLTLLSTHTQDALRAYKDKGRPSSQTAPEVKMSHANTIDSTKMTTKQMLALIESLKSIPEEDHSLTKLIKRAFFKHRAPTFFAVGSVTAAVGAGLQTGLNLAVEALSNGIKHCDTALECAVKDPRFYLPAALTLISAMSFSYALCKSRPHSRGLQREQKESGDIEHGQNNHHYMRLN